MVLNVDSYNAKGSQAMDVHVDKIITIAFIDAFIVKKGKELAV